jgi:hypothetical protein
MSILIHFEIKGAHGVKLVKKDRKDAENTEEK